MTDNGWSKGICFAEPGLPKLLLLSLERVGVVDTPEYIYREYDSKGTLRCDLMIFVGKSTRTLTLTPGSSPPLAFASQIPTERPLEKPCDACVWSTSIIFSGPLCDFSRYWRKRTLMVCLDERTWEGRRRSRRYGLPPIHLPHRPR